MPEKSESVKVPVATMKEYRKWAKETGVFLTFLINRALKDVLARKKKGVR